MVQTNKNDVDLFRNELKGKEEEFKRMRMYQLRRRNLSSCTMICLLIRNSRRYEKTYIRARVNGMPFGVENEVGIHSGCFLTIDCDGFMDSDGASIEVEVCNSEGMIMREDVRVMNQGMRSKMIFPLRINCEGYSEEIEVEIHCITPDMSEGGMYDDLKMIGHRGCGMNGLATTRMMENTISSFLEAYRRGVKWVELDVQLTKDEIPVIFHDFYVYSNGTYSRINEITLHEFLTLVGNPNEENHDSPCTLSTFLEWIGNDYGINIEIKYPLPWQEEEYELKNLIPIEDVVQRVTEVVQRSKKGKIVFSSFHPYILLLLKLHLPNFSTYMLTEAEGSKGIHPYVNSLYEAIYFCTKLGLDGIALDWNCISSNPRCIIETFNAFDLKTMVYGNGVNVEGNLRLLNGISTCGIIIDDLELIRVFDK